MEPVATRASRRGYVLAAALLALSVVVGVGGVVAAARTLSDRVEGFQRVGVPGMADVRFDRAGSYTFYYEAIGVGNEEESGVSLPPVQLSLNAVDARTTVTVDRYRGSFNYSIGGHEGFAVATARIDRPGTYQLRADATIEPGIADVAIGRSLARGLAGTLVAALTAFGTFVAAVVVAIITAVRRRDARRTLSVAG
ncbi:MAG: hypothetical protein M3144_03965 [Actinomycetota bacterium]|nr:hypothetical protein [Actinomycetota bacterium]